MPLLLRCNLTSFDVVYQEFVCAWLACCCIAINMMAVMVDANSSGETWEIPAKKPHSFYHLFMLLKLILVMHNAAAVVAGVPLSLFNSDKM